jgi:hypothetical protein
MNPLDEQLLVVILCDLMVTSDEYVLRVLVLKLALMPKLAVMLMQLVVWFLILQVVDMHESIVTGAHWIVGLLKRKRKKKKKVTSE